MSHNTYKAILQGYNMTGHLAIHRKSPKSHSSLLSDSVHVENMTGLFVIHRKPPMSHSS